ncbi:MAG: thioredoxin domain-containing protein [Candidatus Saccharimonadales bacterium]
MDRNRWFIFAGICVAIVAGLVYTSNKEKVAVDDIDAFAITQDREINDHVYGNINAKVVIYEYADFQCPGCGGAYPNLTSIKEKYKDSVSFVYRHFPLTTIHPHAFAAAATAESAGLQGKFWEMHNLLFDTQDAWSSQSAEQRQKTFEGYARQLGLNMEQFTADLTSDKVAAKIEFDRALGRKLGVDSTPTIYVNKDQVNDDIVSDVIQVKGEKLTSKLNELIVSSGGTVPKATEQ